MNKTIRKLLSISFGAVLLFCNSLTAFAEVSLPEGTAAGLPEKLSVMDSDGNSVSSETGEYFFYVENMEPNVSYTKDIQITNLRDDKAYHIYFYAEPISKSGEIDLENDCTAVFNLDGTQIFEGKVTGESGDGKINLADEPIDLGLYEPGESRKLNCSVVWSGTNAGGLIDYGKKVTDKDGTSVIKKQSGDNQINGEVKFRWIFYAVVDENYKPPNTGFLSTGNIMYIIIMAAVTVVILLLAFLILKRKKRNQQS